MTSCVSRDIETEALTTKTLVRPQVYEIRPPLQATRIHKCDTSLSCVFRRPNRVIVCRTICWLESARRVRVNPGRAIASAPMDLQDNRLRARQLNGATKSLALIEQWIVLGSKAGLSHSETIGR